jgi:hypothetical protein
MILHATPQNPHCGTQSFSFIFIYLFSLKPFSMSKKWAPEQQKGLNFLIFLSIYSFDVRGRAFSKALYWSDTNAFGPRAYFLTVSKPATLSVDNVQLDDEGVSTPMQTYFMQEIAHSISSVDSKTVVFISKLFIIVCV